MREDRLTVEADIIVVCFKNQYDQSYGAKIFVERLLRQYYMDRNVPDIGPRRYADAPRRPTLNP